VQFVKDVELANVPVPFDDQNILTELLADDPVVILTAPEFAQVETELPEIATGAVFMVIVLVEAEDVHPVNGLAVRVNILLPAVISAALGE
jgi:hypothetical protein